MRQQTWEGVCLPKLKILNSTGDAAICGLWNNIDTIAEQIPPSLDRLSVIGNLRTPPGISWFIRGLGEMPHIRRVYIWGSDDLQTGQALVELWRSGLIDHSVPVYGWSVDAKLDPNQIGEIINGVKLVDCRGMSLSDLFLQVDSLPSIIASRNRAAFPPADAVEGTHFPAPPSTILLRAADPADGWVRVLSYLRNFGDERKTRKDEVILHYFNITVTCPVPRVEVIGPPFNFTPQDFETYYSLFRTPHIQGDADYSYCERMVNWRDHNQLEEAIARLRESPETKRATVSLLDATDLETLEDAPCWVIYTLSINNGELHTHAVFRSHDAGRGWPFNVLSILRVHRYAAKRLGVGLGTFAVTSQNIQVYETFLAAAAEIIDKWQKGLTFDPDPSGNFIFDVVDGEVRMVWTTPDGVIVDERYGGDPIELIGDMVARTPGLSPDHIFYLGRQAQLLDESLRTGRPYVQV